MIKKLKEKWKKFFQGELTEGIYKNGIIIPPTYFPSSYERIVKTVKQFWLAHWKWIIGAVIATAAVVVAAIK